MSRASNVVVAVMSDKHLVIFSRWKS